MPTARSDVISILLCAAEAQVILGFTGTRKGLTMAQAASLASVTATSPETVIHGGAQGADSFFDKWLRTNFPIRNLELSYNLEIYPVKATRHRHWLAMYASVVNVTIHPVYDNPLERNEIIARRCNHLLACPGGMAEELRSGTWATIRYARFVRKSITFVWPNGSVTEERR